MLFEHQPLDPNVIKITRSDVESLLSSFSAHPFFLDEQDWLTAEHYYQASKYPAGTYQDKIKAAKTAEQAHKLGERWWRPKKKGWKQRRQLMMTRAIYTKCKTYPPVAEALLATGEARIIDDSMYDYFWGTGRDQRGDNAFGTVLMNVRTKLREEQVV